MKTYRFIFLAIIGISFFSSCTVSHVNENLIIGDWKMGKIQSFIVDKKLAGDTVYTASNKLRLGLDSANISVNEKASLLEFKQGFKAKGNSKPVSVLTDMKNEMNFKPDKTVTILLKSGSLNGTWKMNGKGNKIVVKDALTKKKSTINIFDLDLSKLIICEQLPTGNLTILYKK